MTDPSASGVIAPDLRPVYGAAREKDIDRYLAALLAPPHVRDALVSIAAFSGDTAQMPYTVRDPTLAQIRLHWWHDAIAQMRLGMRTGNPVADAFGEALKPHAHLDNLATEVLAARTGQCENDGPHPVEDLAAFCSQAECATFKLTAGIVGPHALPDQLFQAAGIAYGTTRALLSLPRYLAAGLFSLPESPDPQSALAAQRQRARAHLRIARDMLRSVPVDSHLPVFLPVALVEPYLSALEGEKHDALRQIAEIAPITRIGRLAWARWRGRV